MNMPDRKESYPVLDIACLGSLLLDSAGQPRDPFLVANTLLRDRRNAKLRDSFRAWEFGHLGDLK